MENRTVVTPEHTGGNGDLTGWSHDKATRPEIVSQIQGTFEHLSDEMRQQAKSALTHQKERLVGTMDSISGAFIAMGDHLRAENQSGLADCALSMAEIAERFESSMRDREIDQIFADVESFGRRQPALFLTGAFALGFMASRFFKSSSPLPALRYPAATNGNGMSELRQRPAWEQHTPSATRAVATPVAAPAPPAPSPSSTSMGTDTAAGTSRE